ncbi:1-phosphatidylinositol phosphodiesterase [Merluccius polli]|uniref:1-phosphatidylinositol phosphodiesterase n=1 Tax=Merluccius polli TaxID=89951 RepID=A0AA47NBV3_MERPO|nr:1-phosphatidylinositol phosphodiesterase [Merluccius polli]
MILIYYFITTLLYRVACHGNDLFFNDNAELQLPETYSVPWMRAVKDSSPLSALTVPGTHDSMSLAGGALAQHQAWSLDLQLRAGIRYLELRVVAVGNTLYVMQGITYQHSTLQEVLHTTLAFLSLYPSEAVLLQVLPELSKSSQVNQMVQDLVAQEQRVWVSSGMPTMREVRGKVVLVQKGSFNLGVPLQAEGGDNRVSEIQDKEASLAKLLGQAMVACGGENIVMSHSSGSGFGTFWGMFLTPKRVAERVNPWLNHFLGQYAPNHPRPCFGVLSMDFPGFDLIQNIINLNWSDIMSVTMTRSDGVAILTMKSDAGSACPPLCQILKALCYSPVCCSVSQKLRSLLGTSHSALGMVQVMVGLMNMALGLLLCINRFSSSWRMHETLYPFWLGALFIFFGILCILSEKFPSPCLVVSSVSAHLAGVGFSIAAVVLYSMNLAEMSFWRLCRDDDDYYFYHYHHSSSTTASPDRQDTLRRCLEGQRIITMVLGGINVLLITLSVLQFCVSISCVVLGIKAVRKMFKKENQVQLGGGEQVQLG